MFRYSFNRVALDTDLAGYPAAEYTKEYPANETRYPAAGYPGEYPANETGYPAGYRISTKARYPVQP